MKDSCVCEPYSIRRSERDRSVHVKSGVRSKDDPGRVYEEEIRVAEICRCDAAEDVRWVAASDTTENIRGRQIGSLVQKIGNVVGWDSELAEAVKEVRSVAWPRAACDTVDIAVRCHDRVQT